MTNCVNSAETGFYLFRFSRFSLFLWFLRTRRR